MVFADDTRLLLLGPEALAWRLRQHRAPPTLALLLNRVDGQRLLPGANGHGGHGVGGSAYSGATRRRPASSAWRA